MQLWGPAEFAGAQLWDSRCNKSLGNIAQRVAEHANLSFSQACGSAGRQAAHHIFGKETVSVDQLLAGHFAQTVQRCQEYDLILAAQDTTYFNYSTHVATQGLGPISRSPQSLGLLGHSVLAMSPTGLPLGLLHLNLWARDKIVPETIPAETKEPQELQEPRPESRRPTEEDLSLAPKESAKWLQGLRGTEAAFNGKLAPEQTILLIQDREADIFEFIAAPRMPQVELLIRANHPRLVEVVGTEAAGPDDPASEIEPPTLMIGKLFSVIAAMPVLAEMHVTLPAKPGQKLREAILSLQVTSVWMVSSGDLTLIQRQKALEQAQQASQEHNHAKRRRLSKLKIAQSPDLRLPMEPAPVSPTAVAPSQAEQLSGAQQVWVVRVVETAPPAGVEAVEWVLLSTLKVQTAEQAQKMVGYYVCRWRIERLHFTLKSGLHVETLQIDKAHPLKNAIAVYYVVAWRLLWLTYQGRYHPETPAEEIVTPEELTVLQAQSPQPVRTARDVVRAIAKLGGHPGNPSAQEPGVKTLWIGLRVLHERVEGYKLALKALYAT